VRIYVDFIDQEVRVERPGSGVDLTFGPTLAVEMLALVLIEVTENYDPALELLSQIFFND